MSDYGDDYEDDYGEEWLYVEDEYMQADDLAEHAVQSPPPVALDEDRIEEWDRFDYFNDLEYDFEGYDDANFAPHNQHTGQLKIGQKRKQGTIPDRTKKKQRLANGQAKPDMDMACLTDPPIIWRAQADRGSKPKTLPENAEPYALLKDWREKLANVPDWAQRTSSTPRDLHAPPRKHASATPELRMEDADEDPEDDDEEEEGDGDEDTGIDPTALMAALQSRLATTGGPLSGMDPQQLLQFALRMANNQDAGDDIAGEMADEMLGQGEGEEDEGDEDAEANLLSWVSQQRNANNPGVSGESVEVSTPDVTLGGRRLPTPPSSQAKRSVISATGTDTLEKDAASEQHTALEFEQPSHSMEAKQTSRKRKAGSSTDPSTSPKKRSTRSYEAPTVASQAKSGSARATRSGRVRQ